MLLTNIVANICRLHDFDNNTKLDGLEFLHALQHTFHGEEIDEDDNENAIDSEESFSWIVGTFDRETARIYAYVHCIYYTETFLNIIKTIYNC